MISQSTCPRIIGNPLICGASSAYKCFIISPEPLNFPPDALRAQSSTGAKSHRVVVAFGAGIGVALTFIAVIGLVFWWCYRRNRQVFFDVNGFGCEIYRCKEGEE